MDKQLGVYLEVGKKKVFACALDWPGWCRSGRDEEAAIQALLAYSERYNDIVKPYDLGFKPPHGVNEFNIIERIQGNVSTDFGVPEKVLKGDKDPLSAQEIKRQGNILKACWTTFGKVAQSAEGKQLRKGPRGGGRELHEITYHVARAEIGYLKHLGWVGSIADDTDINLWMRDVHSEILCSIEAANQGKYPPVGPHGGKRWPVRYFIRRVAWHVVDHTWEIEDRIE